jgi:PAS domain S-box-containing protein
MTPEAKRKSGELKLKSASSASMSWLEVVPNPCFLLDRNGCIVASNRLAKTETGYRSSELEGIPIWEFLAEDSDTAVRKLFRRAKQGVSGNHVEAHFRRKDKSILETLVHFSPFNDGVDHDIAVAVVAQNISLQKKKELQFLQFSEVIHRTINPIEITDAKGKIVYVNPAFEKASGYTQEELIGKNPNTLSSGKHPKEFWAKVWSTILQGKVWVGEIQNRRKSGEPFHTQLLISPIIDATGTIVGFLGAHRDITEQKRLEEQLVQSQKMESIGTLAAGIAHEVGNPLMSISSLVQVIQRTTKDEFAKDKLELVKSQINRIANTIRQLVDVSRPSNYEARMTDINKAVRDALGIIQYAKKARDITFQLDLASTLPKLLVVPDQIIQVFINILMNAVDAVEGTRKGVTVRTSSDGASVNVEFIDSGKGIPAEHLSKIFDPFFTTKKPAEGTGLGLWVSYGIVKSFGGDIHVESKPGKGSTFSVLLPIMNAEQRA